MSDQQKKLKVLLLPLTDTLGAASRYRVYQYVPFFERAGYKLKIWPAVGNKIYARRTNSPNVLNKFLWLMTRVFRRLATLFFVRKYDIVFLQRETLPLVYPLIDLAICRLSRRVIFDFDDAIYSAAENSSALVAKLSDPRRAERIFRQCDAVIAANHVLAEYAKPYASRMAVIPTALDFNRYRTTKVDRKNDKITIGWIGSPFTVFYLEMLLSVFSKLARKFAFEVKCVGAELSGQFDFPLKCLPWKLEREIQDVKSFDIGVMPLTDDPWSRGKSGLKVLQYMAAGVAVIASPVGVNSEIICHGQNGLLATTPDEWLHALEQLIENEALRQKLAEAAIATVRETFDINVTAGQIIKVIEEI